MPKLETGMRTSKPGFNLGFTLIEILVVVVILGITASMAIMAFGDFGKGRSIQAEAERFTQKLRLVRYHAILEAVPYKIQTSPTSYQIFRFVPPNQWEKSNIQTSKIHIFSQTKQTILIQASGDIMPFTLVFGVPQKSPVAKVYTDTGHVITFEKM
ncbi:MAG: prepilin-type N-terminal cleavage/methylation domain-containing protein [Legionella sp.]|nr:prepilin-type N-terminal cleavage/methylation domain-containing protein [Legionella sp.]